MEPLKAVVGAAHVVALGEGTHGSKEFFQFKHRMLEFLVEEKGFTVFAMEAGFGEATALNDFILNGTGDPQTALWDMLYWEWYTQEVLDMVLWMRQYNLDPSHVNKVKFYGFDMQFSSANTASTLAYLQLVDPAYAASAGTALEKFKTEDWWTKQAYYQQGDDAKRADAQAIASVLARFDAEEAGYSAITGEKAWALARRHVFVLAQCQRFQAIPWSDLHGENEARDASMAENALWIEDFEGPGAKTVLWAHNLHVSFDAAEHGYDTMGSILKAELGPDLLVLGLEFNQGGFQAQKALPNGAWGNLTSFKVKPAIKASVNAAFASARMPLCLADIRGVPTTGVDGAWWRSPHPERFVGVLYNYKLDKLFYFDLTEPQSYDALMFIDSITVATELPWKTESAAAAAPMMLLDDTGRAISPVAAP